MSENKLCAVEGCQKPAWARNWCYMHYMRWYTHGNSNIHLTTKKGSTGICIIERCKKTRYAKCLCQTHYRKQKKYGDPNFKWKFNGRKINNNGFVLIKKRGHPHCNIDGYIMEHRLKIEECLGRYLKPEEVVHHINRSRSDNRIENLMLFEDSAKHTRYHAQLRKINK